MARVARGVPVYEAAEMFREKCLVDGASLLWPGRRVWTPENVDALWEAFVGNPDEGKRPFLVKWYDQLADEPEDVHRVAVELLAFYYLFPSQIGQARKLGTLEEVVGWKLGESPPDFGALERAYATSIGNAGTQYTRSMPWQLSLYLEFFQRVRSGDVDPKDRVDCQRVVDELRANWGGRSGAARGILLHLFFPGRYERISAENHKRKIVEVFADRVGEARDEDEALLNIRRSFQEELGRDDFDFYDKDVEPLWNPEGEEDEEETAVHFWVEKTLVHGRPDREGGEYALGKALWSPQASKSGGDVYHFMRDVEPGDVVLHLTDNRAFTAVSRAAGPYEEFGGVAGTDWGERPSYLVRLEDYVPLDPPLEREVFLSSPYRERLAALIDAGKRNLFYNRNGGLNQGAYLTPSPEELVRVLNDAYEEATGRVMVDLRAKNGPEVEDESDPLAALADDLLLPKEFLQEVADLLEDKKQVIFYGPPGTGKTYVARKLVEHLAPDRGRREVVQFHPSYSYEDFVRGYRPVTRKDGALAYDLKPGPLMRLADEARKDSEKAHLLLIDEINRGNLPKILGELLYLLEYRNDGVVLMYGEEDERFSLPENLRIIGTMNTADRSIALIDAALRRRFHFVPFFPEEGALKGLLKRWLKKHHPGMVWVADVVDRLNDDLRGRFGPHLQVGPSYFMKEHLDEAALRRVWEYDVMPFLEDQLFGQEELLEQFGLEEIRKRPPEAEHAHDRDEGAREEEGTPK